MSFSIGPIQFAGNLLLAPMDGYTSQPFRVFCRRLGSAGSYSEFIGAIEITQKYSRLDEKVGFHDEERPFAFQIFDNDPKRILRAAEILQLKNPDFIDLNLGCSAKHVSGRGAGAGLLKEPEKISLILKMLTDHLDIPVTAKIRLGWDDQSLNYLEICKIIEDSGCSAVSVHARTKSQGYKGDANWGAIAEIKKSVSIPVIGNGDIRTPQDIKSMFSQTGCDAVMIGRAALSNPWIFSGLDRNAVNPELVQKDIIQLLDLMQDFYGIERGLVLSRKFISRFIAPYMIHSDLRRKILTTTERKTLLIHLYTIISDFQSVSIKGN
jgi:nifR3 family TIM-barrel protein